jgi:predicted nuclease of restriction endonuclease-like (RecB) superfamily
MAKRKSEDGLGEGALIPAVPEMAAYDKSAVLSDGTVDESALFERVAAIIESRTTRASAYANSEVTLMFWEVGQYIKLTVLDNQRATYGKQILTTLSAKLVAKYGKSFAERNIYRMTLFAERFADIEILPTLSAKLSWSHILELLPLKSAEAQLYYAQEVAKRNLSVHELRRQISRKAFERREIANTELSAQAAVPFNVFKDPYLLDVFGLKDNYLEADLEKAILADIEAFILEFGHGFSFVERQKRMIVDGEDIVLDLLFYHRILKRLVAIELKLGKFQAAYMGQMLLYLKWLNRYERQAGEEAPIGIILCATANREKIELLEMDKAGIAVAEYWTHLPPKAEFEAKIKQIMLEAKERLERRKSFPNGEIQRDIDYFIEPKNDE